VISLSARAFRESSGGRLFAVVIDRLSAVCRLNELWQCLCIRSIALAIGHDSLHLPIGLLGTVFGFFGATVARLVKPLRIRTGCPDAPMHFSH